MEASYKISLPQMTLTITYQNGLIENTWQTQLNYHKLILFIFLIFLLILEKFLLIIFGHFLLY